MTILNRVLIRQGWTEKELRNDLDSCLFFFLHRADLLKRRIFCVCLLPTPEYLSHCEEIGWDFVLLGDGPLKSELLSRWIGWVWPVACTFQDSSNMTNSPFIMGLA